MPANDASALEVAQDGHLERGLTDGAKEIGVKYVKTNPNEIGENIVKWDRMINEQQADAIVSNPDLTEVEHIEVAKGDPELTQDFRTHDDLGTANDHMVVKRGNHLLELPVGNFVIAGAFEEFAHAQNFSDRLFQQGFHDTIVGFSSARVYYYVVDACSSDFTRVVKASPPVSTITFDIAEDTEKCQKESLTVGITSPPSTDIATYEWSINGILSTEATAEASTLPGVDSVYAVVTLTTTIGCLVKDSVRVKNFSTDADISSSLFDLSNDSVTLEDDNFIALTAENIVSDIVWSPASIIDDTTATTITVFPSSSPTVVTLSGTDMNGCNVTSTVTIILDNVRPKRTFSPNGDGLGFDCWKILNTSHLVGCKVYVFDLRGKNILVADSPFIDNCVWDGNSNGTPVPEGVYYFVLKCDDSTLTSSGSILLAR